MGKRGRKYPDSHFANLNMTNQKIIPISIIIAGLLISGSLVISSEINPFNIFNTNDRNSGSFSVKNISATEDNILGNRNAPLAIIEYSDTECPFCKEFRTTMDNVMSEYGQRGEVMWVYRHLPLRTPNSYKEAIALECAAEIGGNQEFWSYLKEIYRIKPEQSSVSTLTNEQLSKMAELEEMNYQEFLTCLEEDTFAEKIEEQIEDAVRAGAEMTPFTVFRINEEISPEAEDRILRARGTLPSRSIRVNRKDGEVITAGSIPMDTIEEIIETLLSESS